MKTFVLIGFLFTFPSILSAQYIDTKWTVTGYFGELWFAEEEDILGKHQEFYKGWADGIFIPVTTQGSLKPIVLIREFLVNKEFELVNQEKAFSKVFEENGLMNENTKSLFIGLHAMEVKLPTEKCYILS